MMVGGLQKFTLLDYPEHLAAIIFTVGCNYRCHFCYNPMLVWPDWASKSKYSPASDGEQKDHPAISEGDLFAFLEERAGKLDGIVITGGEPTLHRDLPDFIRRIRSLGYKVKLDTNGTNPEMLKSLLEEKLIDYIAMDIKGSPENYDKVTGVKNDLAKIRESVTMIKESSLPYEFRTTIVPGYVNPGDIPAMGEFIRGAEKWFLQKFKSDIDLLDKELEGHKPYTDKEMEKMAEEARKYVKSCKVR